MKRPLALLGAWLAISAPADLVTKYENWVLGDGQSVYVEARLDNARHMARRAKRALPKLAESATLYDSRKAGADADEVYYLITHALPHLALAARLLDDQEALELAMGIFDRLHRRGFRDGMRMPWKPQQAEGVTGVAIIVDFQLRVSGYALATFLLRDELRQSGRLERSLATCEAVLSQDDKMGNLLGPKLNADGMRVAINFTLPYLLTLNAPERLRAFRQQIIVSTQVESDASDTIKPDGLSFHHRGAYLAGYGPYAICQAAFVAWLFNATDLALPPDTLATLTKSMATLRLTANKYDMHKALAGRLVPFRVIPDVLLGYGYLSDIEHPDRDAVRGMLARLADSAILPRAFKPHRNEVPPGPGAISAFLHSLDVARAHGAEPDPEGHWAFNYGPICVHHHKGLMATIKGHNRYFWAFERSLIDARRDPRLQNVQGFHDSAFSLFLYRGSNAAYFGEGWDPSRIPGTTTRYLTSAELKAMDDPRFNRPFGRSPFCGGVSLGSMGLFAMKGHEQTPDQRKQPLSYSKSAFFIDDLIVMLTSGISHGDGVHPVRTTLYQMRGTAENPLIDPQGNHYTLLGDHQIGSQSGTFSSAWIEHGDSPDKARAAFAISANGEAPVRIRRHNDRAHVIEHEPTGAMAYALFRNEPCEIGIVAQADVPCLILTRREGKEMLLSIVNPDLGWTEGVQFGRRGSFAVLDDSISQPVPTPVQLTLRGDWKLQPHPLASQDEKVVRCELGNGERITLRLLTNDQ